jgi:hypothetical protein
MKHKRTGKDEGPAQRALRLLGSLAAAGAGAVLLGTLPSLRRYLHIKWIAAGQHAMPTMPPDAARSAAQAPRWGTRRWPTG